MRCRDGRRCELRQMEVRRGPTNGAALSIVDDKASLSVAEAALDGDAS
ncbi:hypothetical protein ACP70R_021329 [Stipagrostis hirtigluma subsp. patula]